MMANNNGEVDMKPGRRSLVLQSLVHETRVPRSAFLDCETIHHSVATFYMELRQKAVY